MYPKSRIVYLYRDDQTVTIDYNQTLKLFFTTKEYLPFSTERMLRMLNGWAKVHRVEAMTPGCLSIRVAAGRCVLTNRATQMLFHSYQSRRDWQKEFPYVSLFFTRDCAVASLLPHH